MSGDDFDTLDNLPTIQGDDGKESKLLVDRYKIIREIGKDRIELICLEENSI